MNRATYKGFGWVAGEYNVLVSRLDYGFDGTRPGVLSCHAATGGTDEPFLYGGTEPPITRMAMANYPVLVTDNGGTSNWGNSASQTSLTAAKAALQDPAKGGAKTGKVFLYGFSMGAVPALRWAKDNPTLVHAVLLANPIIDLQWAQDTGGFNAAIDAAHGGNPPAAADPAQNTATFNTNATPIRIYYDATDATAPLSQMQAFDTAVTNCTLNQLSPSVGHTPAALPYDDIVSFFGAYA